VEVVNEDDPSPALLAISRSSSSLLTNYMLQATKIATLEKKNSDLTKANKGLLNENKSLKLKNRELEQKVLELKAQLAAPSTSTSAAATISEQGQHESDQGLSYDELQRMNTMKEATYQTGQDSDASSVDEMTGQEPTLAELQTMNSVRD
jgi:regulator of replication initiation timing